MAKKRKHEVPAYLKVRKEFAPTTRVKQSKKGYSRKKVKQHDRREYLKAS